MIPHSSIHKKHFDSGEKTDVVFLICPLRYNPLYCMLHLLLFALDERKEYEYNDYINKISQKEVIPCRNAILPRNAIISVNA